MINHAFSNLIHQKKEFLAQRQIKDGMELCKVMSFLQSLKILKSQLTSAETFKKY